MKYLSGLYALNLPCNLETVGDWHTSALNWNKVTLNDSKSSIFEDYGIEKEREIPEHKEKYNIANHIRAILDLLSAKRFDLISNFRREYICTDIYDEEIFKQVSRLLPDDDINDFMNKNYGRMWRKWVGEKSMDK